MESKANDAAEDLAKLAIATALSEISVLKLQFLVEKDDEFKVMDKTEQIMTIALAKKILAKLPDVSGWIVGLAQDGLEPFEGALNIYGGDDEAMKAMVRVHTAFMPEFEAKDRVEFTLELGNLINQNV